MNTVKLLPYLALTYYIFGLFYLYDVLAFIIVFITFLDKRISKSDFAT